MAASITHAKVSGQADGGDPTQVQPSDWNAGHTISGLSADGTSFPGSPTTGQRVFRTDLGLDCYYDSTRWLTVGEYLFPNLGSDAATNGSTGILTSGTVIARLPVRQDFGIYLTRFVAATFVFSGNTGSAYWTLSLIPVDGNNSAGSTVATADTSAETSLHWTNHDVAINAVLASSARQIKLTVTTTGSPGGLVAPSGLYYRLIVT